MSTCTTALTVIGVRIELEWLVELTVGQIVRGGSVESRCTKTEDKNITQSDHSINVDWRSTANQIKFARIHLRLECLLRMNERKPFFHPSLLRRDRRQCGLRNTKVLNKVECGAMIKRNRMNKIFNSQHLSKFNGSRLRCAIRTMIIVSHFSLRWSAKSEPQTLSLNKLRGCVETECQRSIK